MEIKGRIIQVLETKSGTGKNGNKWESKEFVIETNEQYPKQVCFRLFGDKIADNHLKENQGCTVYFDLSSREYNSKWYTNLNAWRIAYDQTVKEDSLDDLWEDFDQGIPPF